MRAYLPLLAAASLACFAAAGVHANDEGSAMQTECETDEPGGQQDAAGQARSPTDPDCLTQSPGAAGDARAYWTPERMRNAQPMKPPTLDPETLEPVDPE